MSRLTWTQRTHGWQAGPYLIELAAPGLWVCTRSRGRSGQSPVVEMTSGSLRALKARVERLEVGRTTARRVLRYTTASLLCLTIVLVSANWGHPASVLVVLSSCAVGLFFAMKVIDGLLGRAWDWLRFNYQ